MITNGKVYANGVLKLEKFAPGTRTLIGYIYEGIESSGPQQEPQRDWECTRVANSVFKVYLEYQPHQVILVSGGSY